MRSARSHAIGTAPGGGHNLRLDVNAVKGAVGYMSQRFTLYNDLSVAENLAFTAALRKIEPARIPDQVRELLAQAGFALPPESLVRDLPPGVKQQVALANAMLHDPKVVFLDEPTAGVTPASRRTFWRLIRRIAKSGKTVFVTTHYMDEAEQCDRVALMRAGQDRRAGQPRTAQAKDLPSRHD